jgi:hypothetical protein
MWLRCVLPTSSASFSVAAALRRLFVAGLSVYRLDIGMQRKRKAVISMQKSFTALCVVALTAIWVLPAQAGLLNYAADAYNDGFGPGAGGAWYGTATYASLSLTGSVEWVVFRPDVFSQVLGGNGYTPSSHELVYAFEIDNTGSSDVSTLDAGIVADRPHDNVGSFTIPSQTGMAPATSTFAGTTPYDTAHWFFSNGQSSPTGIAMGQSSIGLAYASINTPELFSGSLVNSGLSANVVLPAPSTTQAVVPEPSTLVLLALAVAIAGFGRRYLRGSK